MSQLRNLYLFFYNLFQALGWALSLFRILSNFFSTKSVNGTFSSAGELICLLQSLAFLEVIHGAIGIVPSGVLLPLMQWGGRTHFLLAIVRRIHEVQELPSVFITLLAWSLSEVIRYSHYALNCMGSPPNWITFIRYNAFIFLYPVGVFPGEMWLMYQALPFIKKENLYADSLPFSYYNFVTMAFVIFISVFILCLLKHIWLSDVRDCPSEAGFQERLIKRFITSYVSYYHNIAIFMHYKYVFSNVAYHGHKGKEKARLLAQFVASAHCF